MIKSKFRHLLYRNHPFLLSNQALRKSALCLCAALFLTGCDLLTPKPQPPHDASGKRAICEAVKVENECGKSVGCGFYKSSSGDGKCKLKADAGKNCRELSKEECELIDFSKQKDCLAFAGECRSDDDFDGNGFDTISKKHRNTLTLADPTGRDIQGVLIVALAPPVGGGVPPVVGLGDPIDGLPVVDEEDPIIPLAMGEAAIDDLPVVDEEDPIIPLAMGEDPIDDLPVVDEEVPVIPFAPPAAVAEGLNGVGDLHNEEQIFEIELLFPQQEIIPTYFEEIGQNREFLASRQKINDDNLGPFHVPGGNADDLTNSRGFMPFGDMGAEAAGIFAEAAGIFAEAAGIFAEADALNIFGNRFLDRHSVLINDITSYNLDSNDFSVFGRYFPHVYSNKINEGVPGYLAKDEDRNPWGFDAWGLKNGSLRDEQGLTLLARTKVGSPQWGPWYDVDSGKDNFGYYPSGFNEDGRYREFNVFENEMGFRASGINTKTWTQFAENGRDFMGFGQEGFNFLGMSMENGWREGRIDDPKNTPAEHFPLLNKCRLPENFDHIQGAYLEGTGFNNVLMFKEAIQRECSKYAESPIWGNERETSSSMRAGLRWSLSSRHIYPLLGPSPEIGRMAQIEEVKGFVFENISHLRPDHLSDNAENRLGTLRSMPLKSYITALRAQPNRYTIKEVEKANFMGEQGLGHGPRREFLRLVVDSLPSLLGDGNGNHRKIFISEPDAAMELDPEFDQLDWCTVLPADAPENHKKIDCFENIGAISAMLTFVEKNGVYSINFSTSLLAQILEWRIDQPAQVFALWWLDDPNGFTRLIDLLSQVDPEDVEDSLPEGMGAARAVRYFIDNRMTKLDTLPNRAFARGFLRIANFVKDYRLNPESLRLLLQGIPPTVQALLDNMEFARNPPNEFKEMVRNGIREIVENKEDEEKEVFLKKLLSYWTGSPIIPPAADPLIVELLHREGVPAHDEEIYSRTCGKVLQIPPFDDLELFKVKLSDSVSRPAVFNLD